MHSWLILYDQPTRVAFIYKVEREAIVVPEVVEVIDDDLDAFLQVQESLSEIPITTSKVFQSDFFLDKQLI